VESYRRAFFFDEAAPLAATARAGNVIGGGDWSEDRLIPDIVRAVEGKQSVEIRSPDATRSWQHVLECLGAYLLLGQQLLSGRRDFAQAWNFGPSPEDNRTVSSVLSTLKDCWPEISWHCSPTRQLHEAKLLYLDSSKARSVLGWKPVWNLGTALKATAAWYRQHTMTNKPLTHEQIAGFVKTAMLSGCSWAAQ